MFDGTGGARAQRGKEAVLLLRQEAKQPGDAASVGVRELAGRLDENDGDIGGRWRVLV